MSRMTMGIIITMTTGMVGTTTTVATGITMVVIGNTGADVRSMNMEGVSILTCNRGRNLEERCPGTRRGREEMEPI